MIVRDEERYLPSCLDSIRPWVDEICIIDTGSSDRTVELAEVGGAHVAHVPWTGDFAAARNRSLELAEHEWVFVIDADETLVEGCGEALRTAITDPTALAFMIIREDLREDGSTEPIPLVRLFRNDVRIRYDLAVHETIMDSLFALGCAAPALVPVRLWHRGYLPDVLASKDKSTRNLDILRRLVQERPDKLFAWWKYAQTLARPEEARERMDAFQSAHQLALRVPAVDLREFPFIPRVFDGYAAALRDSGRLGHALDVVDQGLYRFPTNAELIFLKAELLWRTGAWELAEERFAASAVAFREPVMYGRSWEAKELLPLVGQARAAINRGAYLRGFELLREAFMVAPSDVDARCLWVEAKCRQRDVEGAAEVLGTMISDVVRSPAVQLTAGDVAWMQRDVHGAMQFWQLARDSMTHRHQARCRLAMARWVTEAASAQQLVLKVEVRDVQSAACALLLFTAAGEEPAIDEAFRHEALLPAVSRWVSEYIAPWNVTRLDELQLSVQRREARFAGLADCVQLVSAD